MLRDPASGQIAMVTEYCDQGDLHSLLIELRRRSERVPEAQVLSWLAQLCLPKRRVMDNVVYDPERVEEHEFAIMNETLASAYIGALYFPTRRMQTFERFGMLHTGATAADEAAFLSSMQKQVDVSAIGSGRRRVVLKNPLDTGRVRQILKQFPAAKFIYIHRDPLEVLHSMQVETLQAEVDSLRAELAHTRGCASPLGMTAPGLA